MKDKNKIDLDLEKVTNSADELREMIKQYQVIKKEVKETGIDLSKYKDFKSVLAFQEYMKRKKYFTINERNRKMYADTGTTKQKMNVSVKLYDLDIEDMTGDINDIIDRLNELKNEYKDMCWGKISIDNDKDFWQGSYEGEYWTLIHEYEELESDYNERMILLDKIEKEIERSKKRKKTNKEKKEYEKFLKLKEKYEKENR